MLKEKCALVKLREELEERKGKCHKLHLAISLSIL